MSNGKKMNLPNRLTLARIALTPICVAVIMLRSVPFTDLIGAFLFLLIAITDMLDGKIARKYDLITNFGKFLDPLADKFLVVGTYLALIYRSEGYFTLALIIMTIVTIFREFAVSCKNDAQLIGRKRNVVVFFLVPIQRAFLQVIVISALGALDQFFNTDVLAHMVTGTVQKK